MRRLPLAFILLLAVACSDEVGITGVWTGGTVANVSFQLTLVETPQGLISGVGTLANGLLNLPASATGSHAHPSIALNITFPQSNLAPVNFQGVFGQGLSTIRGVLIGSGFLRDSLILNRVTPPAARIIAP